MIQLLKEIARFPCLVDNVIVSNVREGHALLGGTVAFDAHGLYYDVRLIEFLDMLLSDSTQHR